MVVKEIEQILFTELGYANRPGLLQGSEIPWPNGRAIPNVNAAVFLKDIPIAYFSRFNNLDLEQIRKLHQMVWSQSKAPLLFVILPHEIRIYNGYETTPKPDEELDTPARLLQHLTGLTDSLIAQREIQKQLVEDNHYERIYLETGAFWDTTDGRRINHQNRADRQLVDGMVQMRKLLQGTGLSNHVAYTLLGRSIFIRYLEDREVLTPEWIARMTDHTVDSYRDALNNRQVTYQLFEQLSQRFNGDLFPVEEEEKNVDDAHLQVLLRFLNSENLETGQLSLFHYNFEYIPIELISHIYDTFIDKQRESGAYYTPLLLADFILEETMGSDVIQPEMTVLDPACGSGIFLVGAFRRLISAWQQKNGNPTLADLSRILQTNIFGVDKNQEAVRIAAFSLYLEILNHLTNHQIRDESFRFPVLKSKNLLDCDFFLEEVDKHFQNQKFDRIIGNMPWGRNTLTPKAQAWLNKHKHRVGGKQAAPAFMLRAPEFCKNKGEIAFLTSTKSSILVTSGTHQAFRKEFFETFHVRSVVNFSAMRHELFPGAVSPTVAIFYVPTYPLLENKLVYGVPKPSPLSQQLKAIILDTTEVKFLNLAELLDKPFLWKIALWGNYRDSALIERLKTIPTLYEQLKNLGWNEPREGLQVGESDKDNRNEQRSPTTDFLKNIPFLPTEKFRPFSINFDSLEPIKEQRIHRSRDEKIYYAPLVLIHQSKCQAAFVNSNISYLASISGVTGKQGQENLLKWLVCLINSPLTRYYQFLTSTRWAIERANPLHKEYIDMPFLIPDNQDSNFQNVLYYFDKITELLNQDELFYNTTYEQKLTEYIAEINRLVYIIYGLHPTEQRLVEDMLEYGLEFFNWSKLKERKSQAVKAVQRPPEKMLEIYANLFVSTVTSLLRIKNQTLNATVYQNGTPLTVVSFTIIDSDKTELVQVVTQSDAMRSKLRELDEFLLERKTPSMYIRRHVRVYDGNQISLVRPSEQRFWTQSQARADADAFLAELSA